jgi:hypothetical protein
VAGDLLDLFAAVEVPQPDEAVLASRRKGLLVGRDGDRVDGAAVSVDRMEGRAGRDVPDSKFAAQVSGDRALSVTREDERKTSESSLASGPEKTRLERAISTTLSLAPPKLPPLTACRVLPSAEISIVCTCSDAP